jgi:rhodanese-related sulfurtransferase
MRHGTEEKKKGAATESAAEFFRAKLEYEASPYGLKHELDEKPGSYFVIDVRDASLFNDGHIPGAVSIPVGSLTEKLATIPKDKTIVTYCGDITCPLSSKAALVLAEKGFKVKHLVGGITEWSRKGFPIDKKGDQDGPRE